MRDLTITVAGDPDAPVLEARPEPLGMVLDETAIVVVDMQNAYASRGGYVDHVGDTDLSGTDVVIDNISVALDAARAAGIPVIYLQNGWDSELKEAGGPKSPNWFKSKALKLMRNRPELRGKLLAKGGWDYAIVDRLQPQPDDLVVPKGRYSGFWHTQLNAVLRARGVRNVVFCGIATNVCVETSIRDAFHLEYFAVLLEDACHQVGPRIAHDQAVENIEKCFGWVSDTANFVAYLQAASKKDAAA